jgi:hypothetical protein
MNDTFPSKAAQKREFEKLARVFEKLVDRVTNVIGEKCRAEETVVDHVVTRTEKGETINADFWAVACLGLHNFREKHAVIFDRYLPGSADEGRALFAERQAIKAIPVVTPSKKNTLEQRVVATVVKSLEEKQAGYLEQYEFCKHVGGVDFSGLSVSVSAHWVTNQYGTTFVRHFWYLHGKLTPLNVICAIAQKRADDLEAA